MLPGCKIVLKEQLQPKKTGVWLRSMLRRRASSDGDRCQYQQSILYMQSIYHIHPQNRDFCGGHGLVLGKRGKGRDSDLTATLCPRAASSVVIFFIPNRWLFGPGVMTVSTVPASPWPMDTTRSTNNVICRHMAAPSALTNATPRPLKAAKHLQGYAKVLLASVVPRRVNVTDYSCSRATSICRVSHRQPCFKSRPGGCRRISRTF